MSTWKTHTANTKKSRDGGPLVHVSRLDVCALGLHKPVRTEHVFVERPIFEKFVTALKAEGLNAKDDGATIVFMVKY